MADVRVQGPTVRRDEEVLTREPLDFAAARWLDVRPDTADIRDGDWTVPPTPRELAAGPCTGAVKSHRSEP